MLTCSVCGMKWQVEDDAEVTTITVKTHHRHRDSRLDVGVCDQCRERILRDCTHETLATRVLTLALGSFKDTVACKGDVK